MQYRPKDEAVIGAARDGSASAAGGGAPHPSSPPGADNPPRLLDQVRIRCRTKHYSIRTERAYVGWARRFILANGRRHPRELGLAEIEAFLSSLAVDGRASCRERVGVRGGAAARQATKAHATRAPWS